MVSRCELTDYILHTITNEQLITDFESLKVAYQAKNILIDRFFFRDILYLIAYYKEIKQIYNNDNKMEQFMKSLRYNLINEATCKFDNFPDRGAFLIFYDCFAMLLDQLK